MEKFSAHNSNNNLIDEAPQRSQASPRAFSGSVNICCSGPEVYDED